VRGGRPARALPAKRATHSPPPLGALPASRATHSPPPLGAVPGIAQPALPGTLSPAGHLALVVATSYVLGAAAQATGLDAPAWLPPAAGAALGGTFAGLHHLASAFLWRRPASPLSVVITGGTRGLGKALAREFLAAGDSVLISGRSQEAVAAAVADLQAEANARAAALGLPPSRLPLTGVAADVSRAADVAALAARASSDMGGADVWISNAGVSGSYQPLLEASDETVGAVVATNLLGALRSAKAAAPLLAGAPHGRGHFFLIDGAGADGGATPFYAAYGATKAGLSQLAGSLRAELKPRGVSVHCASPGMMITPLLLEGAPPLARQFFNALAEQPEVVAAFLVPRMRSAVARGLNGAYPRFLTPANALWRCVAATAPPRRPRRPVFRCRSPLPLAAAAPPPPLRRCCRLTPPPRTHTLTRTIPHARPPPRRPAAGC